LKRKKVFHPETNVGKQSMQEKKKKKKEDSKGRRKGRRNRSSIS